LGDAAFNFGWWTQLGVEDPALSWQSLYQLQAGADPHATCAEGRLTPLDAYLRGCTLHQIDHARKWPEVLTLAGIDLHKYAMAECNSHQPQHLLKATWDEELWKRIPAKRRVIYRYGKTSNQLDIWLEDYDAIGWFGVGRYDLVRFSKRASVETN
jgi:hypothetical protein